MDNLDRDISCLRDKVARLEEQFKAADKALDLARSSVSRAVIMILGCVLLLLLDK